MLNRLGWEQRYGRIQATYGALGGSDELYQEVIAKTEYSYDGRASGSLQSVTLAAGIKSVQWVSGALLVRLHTKGTFSATAVARVLVENFSIVPEEPQTIFVDPIAIATAGIASGTTAPNYQVVAFSGAIGPMLQVRLTFDQGATPAAAAQTFSISVDLLGRIG